MRLPVGKKTLRFKIVDCGFHKLVVFQLRQIRISKCEIK